MRNIFEIPIMALLRNAELILKQTQRALWLHARAHDSACDHLRRQAMDWQRTRSNYLTNMVYLFEETNRLSNLKVIPTSFAFLAIIIHCLYLEL